MIEVLNNGIYYQRTVRFQDTDAAGVMYFANGLSICHEAYEASLAAADIDLKTFFSASGDIAVPIAHAEIDFFRPVRVGDRLEIHLTPKQLQPSEFEITYQIFLANSSQPPLIRALTRHVCIHPTTRQRHPLPTALVDWLFQAEA
jgi:1,4-dihydroxy-2-naphthoyl-CoA hydrolase